MKQNQRNQDNGQIVESLTNEIRALKEENRDLRYKYANLHELVNEYVALKVFSLPNKFDLIQEFIQTAYDVNQSLNLHPKQSLNDLFAQKESISNILWPKMETEADMNMMSAREVNYETQPSTVKSSLPKLNVSFWMMSESDIPSHFQTNVHNYRYLDSFDDLGSGQVVVFVMNAAGRPLDDELFKNIKFLSERFNRSVILKLAPNNLKGIHSPTETLNADGISVPCETIFYKADDKRELVKKLLDALQQLSLKKNYEPKAYEC